MNLLVRLCVRFDRWFCPLAAGGFLVTLAVGILVPVYTDEIGWRFQERAGIDGVDKMYNDLCGQNTLAQPPWFMMPVRWFSAAANQIFDDPFFIRLEGLIFAVVWAVLFWSLTKRLEGNAEKRQNLQALSFALLGLGTLPYLMVMSRPEQPLILTLTIMVMIVFTSLPSLRSNVEAWLKVAAIVVLGGIAVSYHLKGVAYAPVALACLAVSSKGRATLLPRLAGAAGLVGLMVSATYYWAGRFQCLGDAKLGAKYANENIASVLANNGQPADLILQALIGSIPLHYVWLAAPDNEPLSSWLPPGLFPEPVFYLIASALTLLWVAVVALAIFMLARFLLRGRRQALAEPRALLAIAIFSCVLVWGASQVNKNAYEAAHVLPMLVVFAALCLSLPVMDPNRFKKGLGRLARVAVAAALLSEIALVSLTGAPLVAAARIPGYLADQPYSVSISQYSIVRRDIKLAMAQAGIPDNRRLHHLMIDDITYLALQRNLLPFHRLGVVEVWNGSIDNPAKFLSDRGSDGVVAACSNLPLNMEIVASRSGAICALSRTTLQELAKPPSAIWNDELEGSE